MKNQKLTITEAMLVRDAVHRENPEATELDCSNKFALLSYEELIEIAIEEARKQGEG